jgi:hypothetical protein
VSDPAPLLGRERIEEAFRRLGDRLAGPERIRLRGTDVLARPEIVGDAGEIERLLGVMTAANPMADRFVAIPKGPEGRLDRASLDAAVRHGFRIIRWHLDGVGAPSTRQ